MYMYIVYTSVYTHVHVYVRFVSTMHISMSNMLRQGWSRLQWVVLEGYVAWYKVEAYFPILLLF